MASGGEGAPFVPLYHRALAVGLPQPVMVLNLGGVGNVTYIDGDTVIAFDTGPASALLDDFVLRRRGVPFDEDGRLAASGHVDEAMVAAFMQNPYFDRPAPKSLDRQDFPCPRQDRRGAIGCRMARRRWRRSRWNPSSASLRHVPKAPQAMARDRWRAPQRAFHAAPA